MRKGIFAICSVLLVLVVSIAVLVPGCCGPPKCIIEVKATLDGSPWTGAVQYTLTGPGAPAASPITGTSVDASHSVDCGNWTCAYVSGGPAGASFVNITPAATQSVANGGTITFTLNFVTQRPLDHFNCYLAQDVVGPISIGEYVYLEDQFVAVQAEVEEAVGFCNPVEKTYGGEVTEIGNPDHHFTFYMLDYEEEPQTRFVEVDNQFGKQQLTVSGPVMLGVPTQKEGHKEPVGLDHFLVYEVIEGPDVDVVVGLNDQFGDELEVLVTAPVGFAIPVQKTHKGVVTEIENPDEHLVFYDYEIKGEVETEVQVVNQFGNQTLGVYGPFHLAVPSEKRIVRGPLDHFNCYGVEDAPPIGEYVSLKDQFVDFEGVLVEEAVWFCNPVEKWHDGVTTPIWNPDDHLTLYDITTPTTQNWVVKVDNQFGEQQELTVQGPVMLAVPTQKEEHDAPAGLDHFLVYEVIKGPYMEVDVGLDDQFPEPGVPTPQPLVTAPVYFANPVQKTDASGVVTEIENPDEHLVFYEVEGGVFETEVQVVNQFGEQTLDVSGPALLAVPSEKTGVEPGEPVVLDHFKCYAAWDVEGVEGPIAIGEVVNLEDQFGAVNATVKSAELFGNPVEKLHDGVLTRISNPDHHLTLYWIQCEGEPQTWQVEVDNQFGTQSLTVSGPVKLAVPTQKEGHPPPVGSRPLLALPGHQRPGRAGWCRSERPVRL